MPKHFTAEQFAASEAFLRSLGELRTQKSSFEGDTQAWALHGQFVFNAFTLELNTHVNTRIHFGSPHVNT